MRENVRENVCVADGKVDARFDLAKNVRLLNTTPYGEFMLEWFMCTTSFATVCRANPGAISLREKSGTITDAVQFMC